MIVILHKVHIQINKPLKQVLQKHLVQRTVFKTYYYLQMYMYFDLPHRIVKCLNCVFIDTDYIRL